MNISQILDQTYLTVSTSHLGVPIGILLEIWSTRCILIYTDIEIKEIINNLRSGISPGYDKIPMWFVKDSNEFITRPLVHIMNLSIRSGIMPDQLKIARVLPIFKSGETHVFSNYRPISVLPIFSKVFESSYAND